MRANSKSRVFKYPLIVLALLTLAITLSSCRTDEPQVPPLTGPSGKRMFITMQARPDHLVIHPVGRPREQSEVTVQLKDHTGTGVKGENVKLRILNADGLELNIGRLSTYNVTTDAAGFASVTYTAPDEGEQPVAVRIYVKAILTNPAYVNEITDRHALELELSSTGPGDCENSPNGPTANFSFSPEDVIEREPVCFTSSSSDLNGSIVSSEWDFGDNTRASGSLVCHSFRKIGLYLVTLEVKDNDGNCDSFAQLVDVNSPGSASCSITATPSAPDLNENVIFQASVDDPNGDVLAYHWNFDDGKTTTTSSATTTHFYKIGGTYEVTLVTDDAAGGHAVCTTTVTVAQNVGNAPQCEFIISPIDILVGTAVQLNASGSTDDGVIVQYAVDWGDSTPVTILACDPSLGCALPVIINKPTPYTAAGSYTIQMIVTDNDGLTSLCTDTIDVSP